MKGGTKDVHTNHYHVHKIFTRVALAIIARLYENQPREQGRLPTPVQNRCSTTFLQITDRAVEEIPVQTVLMMFGLRKSRHEVDHDDQSNLQRPQLKAGFEIAATTMGDEKIFTRVTLAIIVWMKTNPENKEAFLLEFRTGVHLQSFR